MKNILLTLGGRLFKTNDRNRSVFFVTFHKTASSLFSSYVLQKAVGLRHIDYETEIFMGKEDVGIRFEDKGYIYGAIRLIENPEFPVMKRILEEGFIDNKKCIYMVRDPRDMIVSSFYSFGYSHSFSPDKKQREIQERHKKKIQSQGIDDFALKYKDAISKKYGYMSKLIDKTNDYLLLRYEDMINDYDVFFESLSEFLPLESSVKEKMYAVTRPQEKEDITKHKRSGKIGGFKEKLKKETVLELNEYFDDILSKYGYKE